ncbi:MAG: M23 family metallopeptidase [Chloroflexota bacterium]|nr:MAG: M23 family metallopeptidase [Chloroflexota bacterium]
MIRRIVPVFIVLLVVACSSDPDPVRSPTAGLVADSVPPTETAIPQFTHTLVPSLTASSPNPDISMGTLQPSSTPVAGVELCSPLVIHPLVELPEIIGDAYDPPRPGREERHHGIDFAYYHYQERDSMLGEPVQAILPGIVASVLNGQYPYGNMVIVETKESDLPIEAQEILKIPSGQSLYILYAHMDQPPQVALGEQVQSCQLLGEVGMSGNTDIPHLHVETRLGPENAVFESMRFYDTRATVAEMEAYVLWRTSGEFQHFDPMDLLLPDRITATPPGES